MWPYVLVVFVESGALELHPLVIVIYGTIIGP